MENIHSVFSEETSIVRITLSPGEVGSLSAAVPCAPVTLQLL